MKFSIPSQFFISGTDTMVGKTVVSAILTIGLEATYWKPVQSGLAALSDTEFIKKSCELSAERVLPEVYRLARPLSPHLSAKLEDRRIALEEVQLPIGVGRLIVEGAGGLLVPLNEYALIIDLVAHLGLPVLLVARSTLGTINHTLLSVEALRSRNIDIVGVVMNGSLNPDNKAAIEHYAKVPVVAELPPLAALDRSTLAQAFKDYFGDLCVND